LNKLKVDLNSRKLVYVNSKYRYEIEVPDSLEIPEHFEITSKRNGFTRYYTPYLRELIEKLI